MGKHITAHRGTNLRCKGWKQEGILRMLENNLENAEDPENLIIYGGTGKAARNWKSYEAITETLKKLADDETMVIQSGKPVVIHEDVLLPVDQFLSPDNLYMVGTNRHPHPNGPTIIRDLGIIYLVKFQMVNGNECILKWNIPVVHSFDGQIEDLGLDGQLLRGIKHVFLCQTCQSVLPPYSYIIGTDRKSEGKISIHIGIIG